MNIQRSLFCALAMGTLSLASASHAADDSAPAASQRLGSEHVAAQDACLAAVAKSANVDIARLNIIAVQSVGGISVSIRAPGAKKPWTCVSDEHGNVQSTSEGKP